MRSYATYCRPFWLTTWRFTSSSWELLKNSFGFRATRVDADDVANALLKSGQGLPPPRENPMSADRVRWEHIQRIYELCGRNVSETARRLNMHRSTLPRILAKRAPK